MMWRAYFKLKNIIPGRVHFARFGIIDFRRDDLDLQVLRQLVSDGSPYLELTPEGEEFFEPKTSSQTKQATKRKLAD
jgi:hypothetical protein